MIINKIIGNIEDFDESEINKRHIEKVNLESDQLVKRIQRLTTDHDRVIGLQLKDKRDLANGDILYMDDQNIIMVNVLSDELLIIRPKDMEEMGRVAHELGNRHLPAQFDGNEMLIQYDYLTERLLQEMELTFVKEKRQVKHAFRHIGHSHD
jgi:urease accessory protein